MTARLPDLMVAPNGARLGKAQHPAVPLTLPEIVSTARACHAAGAGALHLHLRDAAGAHVLDAGRYREALAELAGAVPDMAVQVTTEAVGRYQPAFQRRLAVETGARMVSVALREITGDGQIDAARKMHDSCRARNIALQYILYSPDEIAALAGLLGATELADPTLQLLFVLGGHGGGNGGQNGAPAMLDGFLAGLRQAGVSPDWMVCAFGPRETDCLLAAHRAGGKLRVGFENSLWMQDGRKARDNAARVDEVRHLCAAGAPGEHR